MVGSTCSTQPPSSVRVVAALSQSFDLSRHCNAKNGNKHPVSANPLSQEDAFHPIDLDPARFNNFLDLRDAIDSYKRTRVERRYTRPKLIIRLREINVKPTAANHVCLYIFHGCAKVRVQMLEGR